MEVTKLDTDTKEGPNYLSSIMEPYTIFDTDPLAALVARTILNLLRRMVYASLTRRTVSTQPRLAWPRPLDIFLPFLTST